MDPHRDLPDPAGGARHRQNHREKKEEQENMDALKIKLDLGAFMPERAHEDAEGNLLLQALSRV